ncbi:phosphoribosylglycinamide formyltransferase [Rapidithrix thailandica]|uniref:Phosphoribosylglycinamide formyltransferase n=1 Tax=Rapidithrix thailandica TaxID=413964 RepID=A0AAW9S967_9BACT
MHISIFASGSGSNAQRIIEYFREKGLQAEFSILTNNAQAYVIERAKQLEVPFKIVSRKAFKEAKDVLEFLEEKNAQLIVLAGFLQLVPEALTQKYTRRIINIHPALLPKFGGKGMYGHFVHEAVVAAGEQESGITIHYVNERYDEGEAILQKSCPVETGDTPDDVARKVQQLEHQYFPKVVEELAKQLSEKQGR